MLRRDVEGVEDRPTENAASVELQRPYSGQVHLVAVGLLTDALEMQQPEREGERDQRREDAAPENELMCQPPSPGPASDEALGQ